MDVNSFYGTRTMVQVLVPENPQDADADLSDVDDPIEDPDYREEVAGDSSSESLDEDDAPPASTSSTKSSSRHLYLYSAFNNTNCVKATSQYQNRKIVSQKCEMTRLNTQFSVKGISLLNSMMPSSSSVQFK